MSRARWTIVAAVIAFTAAIAGVGVGRWLFPPHPAPAGELHSLLHRDLMLDTAQEARIAAIETRFAERRRVLEQAMRADNARLADAIAAEHGYGPRVAAAVDACHHTMGALQKVTLAHVFAMRQELRPDQTEAFDRAVVKALTAGER